eukprot:SAG22_NODE_843_length_6889_cov_61.521649_11_plen_104_part_01
MRRRRRRRRRRPAAGGRQLQQHKWRGPGTDSCCPRPVRVPPDAASIRGGGGWLSRRETTAGAADDRRSRDRNFLLNGASLLRPGDLDGPSGLSTRTLSPPRPKT